MVEINHLNVVNLIRNTWILAHETDLLKPQIHTINQSQVIGKLCMLFCSLTHFLDCPLESLLYCQLGFGDFCPENYWITHYEDLGPVSSKCLGQDFVLENVLGRFKDKSCVSSNSRNLGSSQILS